MVLSVKCIFSDGQQQHHLILLIPHWTPSLSHHAGSHGIFWVVNKRCQKQQRHYSPVMVRHMLRAIVPTSSAQLSKPVKSLLQCPVYSGKVGSYLTNCWTVLDIKKWVIFEFFSKFLLNDTQCFCGLVLFFLHYGALVIRGEGEYEESLSLGLKD